jgi:phospholipase/carboxylesterase
MEARDEKYTAAIRGAEDKLLHFFRTFEKLQEEIHLGRVGESQARLREAGGELFPALTAELAALSPPESLNEFHAKLSEAVASCAEAYTTFLSGKGQQFAQAFLGSRQALCRGLYLLYDLRAQLPTLQQYWLLPSAVPALTTLESQTPGVEVPVGFSHKPSTNTHAPYSLYVPENYTPQQTWPLIVCLHGGYGRGDDYIWTWLRPAKSKGYLLLSPKSAGPTWSILNPPLDIRSIQVTLEEVCATYAVDRKRVYLTGLSDGGTFTYLLGLSYAELFAGIAVVAGEMHPMVDTLLRRGQGKAVPMLIVHGVQDFIFDVQFTRQTCALLQKLGYTVTYQELPDWGHAYTYTINEQRVLPWFENISSNRN